MNAFPAAGDYYKAVQAPGRCFTVPKLQAAEFVWDSLGPTLARGSSAVVFQASIQGRPQALRCYIREDASSRDRYSALDTYLAGHDLSPYVSGTTWLDGAITVNRAPWPVLTMDWIDGRTLNEYVDFLVAGSNAAALTTLAGRWRELVALLQRSEFAHGDLQHGNVMVDQDGQLRLVDFDGVLDSAADRAAAAHRVRPPELPAPLAPHLGPLARHLLRPGHLLVAGRAGQGSGALAGPVQLQEPAVRQDRLLPPVHDRGLEAAGRAAGPAGRRASQEAAGVLQPALGVQPEPGGDPGAAGRFGPAAGTGRPALVAAAARARRGNPGPSGARPGVAVAAPAAAGPVAGPRGLAASAGTSTRTRRGAARGSAGGLAARPAPAVRAARHGRYRTHAAAQPDDDAAQRHDLVDPAAGQAQGQAGPGYRGSGYQGSAPSAPMPRGYAPHAPVPTPPGPPVPGPAAPATRTQTGPVVGAVALALGVLLLVIGAASHIGVVVIGGLVLGAWGMWRLVTATGRGGKPPG